MVQGGGRKNLRKERVKIIWGTYARNVFPAYMMLRAHRKNRAAPRLAAGAKQGMGASEVQALLRVVIGISLLIIGGAGCSPEAGVSEISEGYRRQLEEKDHELAALRGSEGALRAELGELRGQLKTQQAEIDAARNRPPLDVAVLAKELAPLLPQPALAARPGPPLAVNDGAGPTPPGSSVRGKTSGARGKSGSRNVAPPGPEERRRIEVQWPADQTRPQAPGSAQGQPAAPPPALDSSGAPPVQP
jgi:hypothetical protein